MSNILDEAVNEEAKKSIHDYCQERHYKCRGCRYSIKWLIPTYKGRVTQKDLNITETQLFKYENSMALIQDVFPNLNPEEREFIKTGYCDDCQNILFNIEDEEE